MQTTSQQNGGFTLFELIVVLLLISIITFFAVPSFNNLIQKHRYRNALTQLTNDLIYAKNYANRHKTRVSVCNSSNGLTCAGNDVNNWAQGWIVFTDPQSDFNPLNNSNKIIRYSGEIHKSVEITSSGNIKNGINFNKFRRYGKTLGAGLPNGHFLLCARGQVPYKVIINVFGASRYESLQEKCS